MRPGAGEGQEHIRAGRRLIHPMQMFRPLRPRLAIGVLTGLCLAAFLVSIALPEQTANCWEAMGSVITSTCPRWSSITISTSPTRRLR